MPCARAPIVAVVGSTASGKTELSLDLAERLGGEIVNTDAMQVYRGMDIGTAKLPPAERRGIPHHLLDRLDVREPATVAEFQGWARDVIARAARPRHGPGAGRRLRALHPRDPGPLRVPGHRRGRARPLGGRARGVGAARAARPAGRASTPRPPTRIRPDNGRRIVRALEVVEITGRPFSASLPAARVRRPAHPPGRASTSTGRPWTRRIEQRVRRDVRRPASSRRSSGCSTKGWPRAAPRPARSATAR